MFGNNKNTLEKDAKKVGGVTSWIVDLVDLLESHINSATEVVKDLVNSKYELEKKVTSYHDLITQTEEAQKKMQRLLKTIQG